MKAKLNLAGALIIFGCLSRAAMPRDDGAERWNLMWRSQNRWLVERSAIEHRTRVDRRAGKADCYAAGRMKDRQAGRDIPDRRA